ncbi:MAG TPA: MarR family transcriptional regulator [Nocardioidaceae bacterium]|nr:MarR family transcriptional regulator [Nocardioidaceae bacterium]
MSQPDLERLGSELVVLSARLVRAVRRALEQPTGVRTLSLLDEHGPSTVTQLAQADRCSQPTMTGTVNVLVGHGWVRRTPHPADARSSLVELTDEGRRLLASTRRGHGATVAERLARTNRFGTEELGTAVALLREILDPPAGTQPDHPEKMKDSQ